MRRDYADLAAGTSKRDLLQRALIAEIFSKDIAKIPLTGSLYQDLAKRRLIETLYSDIAQMSVEILARKLL